MTPSDGLDTSQIKTTALKDLLDLLEGVRGKKILFLDKSLSGPIGLFAKFSVLQDYGVDKIYWLDEPVTEHPQKNIVYLARCTVKNAYIIANQIKTNSKIPGQEFEYSVFLTPRRTLVCEKIFEDEGILGEITIREFPLYFIPLEPDLLSLELESSFEELYLRKDHTSIFYSARALMSIQRRHGLFPRIIGKGDRARQLADLLIRMRNEEDMSDGSPFALTPSSVLGELIIIDREVDFVTPLMTQLTYEGLIDETIGIQHSKIELDAALVGPSPQQQSGNPDSSSSSRSPIPAAQQKKRPVLLSSEDKLFDNLRDTNFAIVGNLLNKVARRLNDDYEGRHQAKTVSEIRQFVGKLGGLQQEHQSLKLHTGLAEEIMKHTRSELFNKSLEVQQNLVAGIDPSSQHDAIEELIARAAPLESVLRLLCIESLNSSGFKPKDLENFKREILQGYGYQHVLTLNSLEKLGFLQSRAIVTTGANRTSYSNLRKTLRLIVDEVNEHDPDDISYVYSGYAPLSIRLVQCVIQKPLMATAAKGRRGEDGTNAGVNAGAVGWRGFEDVLKSVRGKTFDEPQRGEEKAVRARNILNGQNDRKVTVVFFLGGCTFTEISALRFIGKKEESRRRIVVGTTAIINGNKMMEAASAYIVNL